GNIYIANTFYGTVEKYNSSGILISSNWATGLNKPAGMSSDSSNIYIADEGDDVIYKVPISSGGTVSTACSPAGGNNGFLDPKDIDVDSNGDFYIAGINSQNKYWISGLVYRRGSRRDSVYVKIKIYIGIGLNQVVPGIIAISYVYCSSPVII
ncbi:unnamed protein product, partial [marine sediment metagenome]